VESTDSLLPLFCDWGGGGTVVYGNAEEVKREEKRKEGSGHWSAMGLLDV
jgi:hypothetical protein